MIVINKHSAIPIAIGRKFGALKCQTHYIQIVGCNFVKSKNEHFRLIEIRFDLLTQTEKKIDNPKVMFFVAKLIAKFEFT